MPSLGHEGPTDEVLDAGARDLHVEAQRVSHESCVHLDIEMDDQVARLEALGARKVGEGPR